MPEPTYAFDLYPMAAQKVTVSDQVDTPAILDPLTSNSIVESDDVNRLLPASIDADPPQ